MKHSKGRVRLGIIGSGAIAEEGYLPAADLVSNIIVTHVVDLDGNRAREVANRFQVSNSVTDYREIFGKVDAVVVATPPRSHAKISIDCLNHGLHVLCEKPLATSLEEAKEMLAASERTHTHLAVGMVRRMTWSSQTLRKLLKLGVLGTIHRFDVEEGWEFNWPLRTGYLFQTRDSKGVIADTGTHLFDLLLWILDGRSAQVISCEDDNWGGIEANAVVELEVETSARRVTGRIELSFTRRLRNTMKFYGEKGCLEAMTVGAYEIYFSPSGHKGSPLILKPQNSKPRKRYDDFVTQLSTFVNSINNNSKDYVTADEALKSMAIIEECYRKRKLAAQSWVKKHLESFFENTRDKY